MRKDGGEEGGDLGEIEGGFCWAAKKTVALSHLKEWRGIPSIVVQSCGQPSI